MFKTLQKLTRTAKPKTEQTKEDQTQSREVSTTSSTGKKKPRSTRRRSRNSAVKTTPVRDLALRASSPVNLHTRAPRRNGETYLRTEEILNTVKQETGFEIKHAEDAIFKMLEAPNSEKYAITAKESLITTLLRVNMFPQEQQLDILLGYTKALVKVLRTKKCTALLKTEDTYKRDEPTERLLFFIKHLLKDSRANPRKLSVVLKENIVITLLRSIKQLDSKEITQRLADASFPFLPGENPFFLHFKSALSIEEAAKRCLTQSSAVINSVEEDPEDSYTWDETI